jgi:hypothetical protein
MSGKNKRAYLAYRLAIRLAGIFFEKNKAGLAYSKFKNGPDPGRRIRRTANKIREINKAVN